jgi:hypothetical protein
MTKKKKPRKKWKTVPEKGFISSIVGDANSEVNCLMDEMTSWRDGMEGTGLENTSKFAEVSEAADSLENIESELTTVEVDLSELLHKRVKDVEVEYVTTTPYGRRAPSRAMQAANVSNALNAVVAYLNSIKGEAEEDASTVADTLDSVMQELQTVDFPGMY